jgi:hypothetical protein
VPAALTLMMVFATFGIVLVGAFFVFRLGILLYGTVKGVFAGVCALFPCVGLIALLIVNGKATRVLRENHIRVGFLGADPSRI